MESEYREANRAFEAKYKDISDNIASHYGVDSGVGVDMLKSNLEFDRTVYKGGGYVESETWAEMLEDYRRLKNIAVKSME